MYSLPLSDPRGHSITPSDSISRWASGSTTPALPSPSIHQPATRPAQYPAEILWSFGDCKDDPDVVISASNQSRPSMERAIRHPDGKMITPSEYSAIRASARLVKLDLLNLPTPKDRLAKSRPKTRSYYRTFFAREWQAAVDRLEQLQPLLALCSAHWKAEHLLGSTLLTNKINLDDSADDNTDAADFQQSDRPVGGKRRRNSEPTSPRKRRRGGIENDVSESGSGPSDHSRPRPRPRSSLNTSSFLSRLSLDDGTSVLDTSFIKVDPHGTQLSHSYFIFSNLLYSRQPHKYVFIHTSFLLAIDMY